ncbi:MULTISPECIES: RDD family protein [Bacillus]|uniref:RDD family protein n=1 Tax=Bacillus TaxID=1386 RepID=UPI000C76DDEC|nr:MULTISPECIES: RDD family protein [Bacillus]PLR83793.1 RDD family protein [Bacillus sp. V33-4]RSK53038.1 RDD family protein [Bacillus canaveralius]
MSVNDSSEKNLDQQDEASVTLESLEAGESFPAENANRVSDSDYAVSAPPAPVLRFAGFWMRFWAYLLDLIVVGSIDRLIMNPIFRVLDIPLHEMGIFAPITIATAITFYAYFVLMTKFFGQTLGKMVFGLKVVDLDGSKLSWGTVLFREWIGRFISSTIIVGYIIVAFLPKKQGLHDLFSDTTVVHER